MDSRIPSATFKRRLEMVKPPRIRLVSSILLLLSLGVFFLGLTGTVLGQGDGKTALVAEVDGIINPVSQRHITKSVERGEKEEAVLVIILLDTPGGLLSSTRKIFESLLNAQVPTVVYVSPAGAQAASAGTFITAAAHFAVMAPGTSIGAATPVGGGGNDLPDTLKSKAINAAAADMRAIAEERGRNGEKLEETVRQAVSFSASEAVDLNVVDFIAQDIDDLLRQLDGQTTTVNGREITLYTTNLTIRKLNMSVIDQFLFILADPNIAFLLLSIGGLAVVIEVLNPGLIFPGVTGAIFLVLAFVSLGNLPVNWAGAALILLAGGLIIAEIYVSGFGVLGVGGIISFILGALLLFSHFGTPSPTAPSLGVSLWIVAPSGGLLTLVVGWVLWTMARSGREQRSLPFTPIVGMEGIAITKLDPRGTVRIGSETWTADANYGTIIEPGERVRIQRVGGTIITVVPAQDSADQTSPQAGV